VDTIAKFIAAVTKQAGGKSPVPIRRLQLGALYWFLGAHSVDHPPGLLSVIVGFRAIPPRRAIGHIPEEVKQQPSLCREADAGRTGSQQVANGNASVRRFDGFTTFGVLQPCPQLFGRLQVTCQSRKYLSRILCDGIITFFGLILEAIKIRLVFRDDLAHERTVERSSLQFG
jgi:hypothetical protein